MIDEREYEVEMDKSTRMGDSEGWIEVKNEKWIHIEAFSQIIKWNAILSAFTAKRREEYRIVKAQRR